MNMVPYDCFNVKILSEWSEIEQLGTKEKFWIIDDSAPEKIIIKIFKG